MIYIYGNSKFNGWVLLGNIYRKPRVFLVHPRIQRCRIGVTIRWVRTATTAWNGCCRLSNMAIGKHLQVEVLVRESQGKKGC